MMIIGGRNGAVQLTDHYAIAPDAEVYDDDATQDLDDGASNHQSNVHVGPGSEDDGASDGAQIPTLAQIPTQTLTEYLPAKRYGRGVDSLQSLKQHAPVARSFDQLPTQLWII